MFSFAVDLTCARLSGWAPSAGRADRSLEVLVLQGKLGMSAQYRLTLAVVLSAWLFGGASRFDVLATFIAPAVSLVAIAIMAGYRRETRLTSLERWCWGLLFAIFAVQLVPLPPAVWTQLPSHQFPRDVFAAIDAAPWLTLSLTPSRTFASLFALFPAFAVYWGARGLNRQYGDRLLIWLVGFAAVSALLGLFQVAGGSGTALRFYSITNRDAAVGFFSNANHFGIWLACCVPAAIYLALRLMAADQRGRRTIAATALALVALMCIGAIASFSRAAYGAIFATMLFAAAALIYHAKIAKPLKLAVAGGGLVALVAAMAIVMSSGWFERIAEVSDLGERGRLQMVPIYLRMIGDTLPLGTGIGSFDGVHRAYETYENLGSTYLNNAHNDLAQILIEAGVLAAVALVCWLILIVRRSISALRDPSSMDANDLGAVRAIALILPTFILLGHSLVDYPLRASATATTFMLFVALLAGAKRNKY